MKQKLLESKVHLRINSLVALRDREGLSGASSLPYFFLEDDDDDASMLFEMLDVVRELWLLLTVLFDELKDDELLSCCRFVDEYDDDVDDALFCVIFE